MKKIPYIQRVRNRFQIFYNSLKSGIISSLNIALMIIGFTGNINKTIIFAPVTLIVAAITTVIGSIYSSIKAIVNACTRKPVYDMSDTDVNAKLAFLENNPELFSKFITVIVQEYLANKTHYASHDSKRLIDKLIMIAKKNGLLLEENLLCHYVKRGLGEKNITTEDINNYLIANKKDNKGKRLFNLLYEKLDFLADKERAEIRKNARILHQIARNYHLNFNIFKSLGTKICTNSKTSSVSAEEASLFVHQYFKRP